MAEVGAIQGELQEQVMAAIWRVGSGTVDQVRDALPSRYRGAYTTVQTVMNRLADRGLLDRSREGRSFVYRPRLTEAEYVSGLINRTLAGATAPARQAALAEVLGSLQGDQLDELQRLAKEAAKQRQR